MEISSSLAVFCVAGGVNMLLDIVCAEISFNSVLLSVNSLLCESLTLKALIFLGFMVFVLVYLSFRVSFRLDFFRKGHCLIELIFVK